MTTLPKKPTKLPTKQVRIKRLEKELDVLWSKIVHGRWGHKCGWPGCTYQTLRLGAHHWIHKSAGYKARWNLNNGILLDYFHHIHEVHQRGNTEPIRDAIIEKIGLPEFEQLRTDCTGVWKPTLDELVELKSVFANEVEKGEL